MRWWKIYKLEYLENGTWLFYEKKKLLACASDDTVWEAIIVHCAEATFHVSAKMKGIYHL